MISMKKLLYILFVVLLLSACTKETIIIVEVPAEESADDTDGDGVKNSIEETDGTDPEEPCSYLETQHFMAGHHDPMNILLRER